jgi:hypothetical protein
VFWVVCKRKTYHRMADLVRKTALIRGIAAMKDPGLLSKAAKLGMDIDPMPGSRIDGLLADLLDAS